MLNPDARTFHQRAAAEGLDIGWHELDGGMHVWMLLPGHHAGPALARIRQVLRGRPTLPQLQDRA